MRLAILCDGKRLARWQKLAVEAVADEHEWCFLVARDVRPPLRSPLRHGLYYLLNLVAIRNSQTRPVPFAPPADAADRCFAFVPGYDGSWATLPDEVVRWLAEARVEAVVKFALGLLRIPPHAPPILSWHHGDPARFRGRPAGFYELVQGELLVGQIVQRLDNSLDAGEILAFAETRVYPHSYRKTLTEAFALSPHLLRPALAALERGERVDRDRGGRLYRLPSNLTVARMLARSAGALARHLLVERPRQARRRRSKIPQP